MSGWIRNRKRSLMAAVLLAGATASAWGGGVAAAAIPSLPWPPCGDALWDGGPCCDGDGLAGTPIVGEPRDYPCRDLYLWDPCDCDVRAHPLYPFWCPPQPAPVATF